MATQNLLKLLMMINSLLRNFQYTVSYISEELFQIGIEQFNLSTAGKGCQNLDRWSDIDIDIDVSLACEDGNSKLVESVDDEKQFTW